MKHDIKKLISEYKEMFTERREPFVLSDIPQLYESARTKSGFDTATAVMHALMAGYALGYKTAKKTK